MTKYFVSKVYNISMTQEHADYHDDLPFGDTSLCKIFETDDNPTTNIVERNENPTLPPAAELLSSGSPDPIPQRPKVRSTAAKIGPVSYLRDMRKEPKPPSANPSE